MIQLNQVLLVALDLPGRACTAPTRSACSYWSRYANAVAPLGRSLNYLTET